VNVYIWESVEDITNEYHSDGGVIASGINVDDAISNAIETAKKKYPGCDVEPGDFGRPDAVIKLWWDEGDICFIFPDKGCC
jgi:hypothetical protein